MVTHLFIVQSRDGALHWIVAYSLSNNSIDSRVPDNEIKNRYFLTFLFFCQFCFWTWIPSPHLYLFRPLTEWSIAVSELTRDTNIIVFVQFIFAFLFDFKLFHVSIIFLSTLHFFHMCAVLLSPPARPIRNQSHTHNNMQNPMTK